MKYIIQSVCLFLCMTASVQAETFRPFQPLPTQPPIPEGNLQSAAKISLGQQLYFDRRLSVNNTLSCNSCHDLMAGGADSRAALSKGVHGNASARSAPTLWNVAYQTVYFWDGRANSIEEALNEHLTNPIEMGQPNEALLVERLLAIEGYQSQFETVFKKEGGLNYENVTRALASYIRTLVTTGSAFDRYLEGDKTAISAKAKKGFHDFIEVGCASCHFWVNLAGPVPGLSFQMGEGFYELFPNYPDTAEEKQYGLADDLGRYYITSDETDKRMWRVPVLRNIELTRPYFHNGSVATLEEAVRVMAVTQLDRKLKPREIDRITVFLKTLTGDFPEQSLPRLPD